MNNNDRKQLIRIAAGRPVGDPVRRVVLGELKKARMRGWESESLKNALDQKWDFGSTTYRNFFKALDKRQRSRLPTNNENAWVKAMAKLIMASGAQDDLSEREVLRELKMFISELGEQAYENYDLNDPPYIEDDQVDEFTLEALKEVNKL